MTKPFWQFGPIVLLGTTVACMQSVGQDPFGFDTSPATAVDAMDVGAGASVEKDQSTPAIGVSIAPDERSAVVTSLRSNPPRTAKDLGRAILLMTRISRWDEAAYWLEQADKFGINEASSSQIASTAGTQTFLRLLAPETKITAAQKAIAEKILIQARSQTYNEVKLAQSAKDLLNSNKAERVRGFRNLQFAGSAGVAALINLVLSDSSVEPNATMSEAFVLLGQPAFEAWKTAMNSSDPLARARLSQLAARTGEASVALELCAAANDKRLPDDARHLLAQIAAARNKAIPGGEVVHAKAIELMKSALTDYQRNRWSDEVEAYVGWQLSSDGKSVVEVKSRAADLYWQRAVHLAHTALQSSQEADLYSALAFAILLEEVTVRDIELKTQKQIADYLPSEVSDTHEFAGLIWDAAKSNELPNAQVMAVSNLARWLEDGVGGPIPVRERLVEACSSPHASVRYESAAVLVKSMYSESDKGTSFVMGSFDGRNRLEKVLAEMRNLSLKPKALILGGSPSLRSHLDSLTVVFGYEAIQAPSFAAAMQSLREGQPVDAVFVVDRVRDISVGQLVQRLRSVPGTAASPIAILADSLSNPEHELLRGDGKVVMGSVPPNEAGLVDLLRRMKVVSQSPKIDSVQRIAWKETAGSYWSDAKKQFVAATPDRPFSPTVESPMGQKQLLTVIANSALPLPQREQASQIFVQSVKQFGLQITSETEKAQYDEYNTRGPTDLDLRVVLGRALDAIEAGRGKRPWSEVAR